MQSVLVVGQCPPPVHGQAIMIEALLHAPLQQVRLFHVPMAFSSRIDQVGKFALGKILHLFVVIARIYWARLRHGPTVLYFPPAGPDRLPMYRDWIILLSTRWLFRRTVFHFHAGGLSELFPHLSRPGQALFRRAYGSPDCAIHLSAIGPQDGPTLLARRNVNVPNGIADAYPPYLSQRQQRRSDPPCILFVGALRDSKGVRVLLEAARLLLARGLPFRLELMGAFQSADFEKESHDFLSVHNLQDHVHFLGVCRGPAKWEAYARSDIFCFPSFYESENLPVVIIEAMQFELPVVATRWRGIPALVEDGDNGLLVAPHSPEETAAALARLLDSQRLRQSMGRRGREIYLQEFTLQRWSQRMEQVFLDLEPASVRAPAQVAY